MSTPLPALSLVAAFVLAASVPPAQALPFDSTAVEIVQFTDYQCPFCGRVEDTLATLRRDYGATLRVVVKHQPLAFHTFARGAAEAAEAARNQGQFEAMHDRLFANQQALTPDDLVMHARALGLDMERFKRDLVSPEVKERVSRDIAIANALGVTGTPTFFINGKNLRGAQPVEEFKRLIDEEIAEATRGNRRGDKWLSDRLSANNSDLWGYLRGGQVPPKGVVPVGDVDDEAPEVVDKDVYFVPVDPNVDAYDGPADALVTMVEYLDYQCPFCQKLEPTMGELMTRYAGKIRRVVKHNPLSFHKAAKAAASAAICAQAQGRFWQMHESLYADISKLDAVSFKNRASALGLDLVKFERCLAAPTTEARLKTDADAAFAAGARGTPNTFINGRKLIGAKALEDFSSIIDAELKRAQAQLAAGVKPQDLYGALIKGGKSFSVLADEVFKFVDAATTPILGNPNAKIRITVFGDLQCPFCARAFEPLQELVKLYRGKVALAWKHFPLSFHQQAMQAAKAAMCAHEQRKFWQAGKRLYASQTELAASIEALPDALHLDPTKYASCMNMNAYGPAIDSDMAEGRAAGVLGTPTLFIQGRKYNSSSGYSVDALKPVIDALLAGRKP